MEREKILFICTQNRLRSPTAEVVFADRAETRSAGLSLTAKVTVTSELLAWADIIFVMDKSHLNKLNKKFKADVGTKKVVHLHIADEYDYCDPELIRLLELKVPQFLRPASTVLRNRLV